jgi:hypothetical protein
MAKGQIGRKQAAPVKYDSEGKRITPGVKYDSEGKRINSNSTPQSTPRPTPKSTPKPTPKTPSSTAQVPKGGAALPKTSNLARSLIKRGVGRLIPGVGLILTAVEVADYLRGGETATNEPANYGGQMGRNRRKKESESPQERAERVTRDEPSDLTELRMREDLKNPRNVLPAPRPRSELEGRELAVRAEQRRAGSDPDRPSTINTRSEKPLLKRIMEALGDNRTMEQASEDAMVTKEMEMEREMNVAGRKKGGMAKKKKAPVKKAYGGMGQKKKAPVKKAYGGMVKKKHGGSANKVNMKAGFTRRGCSKG